MTWGTKAGKTNQYALCVGCWTGQLYKVTGIYKTNEPNELDEYRNNEQGNGLNVTIREGNERTVYKPRKMRSISKGDESSLPQMQSLDGSIRRPVEVWRVLSHKKTRTGAAYIIKSAGKYKKEFQTQKQISFWEDMTQFQYSEKYHCGRVLKNLTPHRMH